MSWTPRWQDDAPAFTRVTAEHGPEAVMMTGGEAVIGPGDDEGEYVCPRCERDQCERCRDADCRCCGGRPA